MPAAQVALVLCQRREAVVGAFEAEEQPYQVLVDESRDVARAYGVYVMLGLDSVNIARPATFVIGTDRVIRFVFVASHQWETPADEPVRAALEDARG